MPDLPSGTVTFLFTDIEGSTTLLKALGDDYGDLLREHRRMIRDVFSRRGGREIDTQGDAFFYSFTRARDAVGAAVEAQRATVVAEWPGGVELRVRMGLHTGEPALGEEGYLGLDVVRAARLAATGRGGQVLLSETTRALIGGDLPEGVRVRDLGTTQLKDIEQPEPVFELVVEGVEVAATSPAAPAPASAESAAQAPAETAAAAPESRGTRPPGVGWEDFGEQIRTRIEERVLAELEQATVGGDREARDPARRRRDRSAHRRRESKDTSPGDALRWGLVGLGLLVAMIAIVAGVVWSIAQLF